jgi:hypothetical protein
MNEKFLRDLMFRFPGCFVGFFDVASQVLATLATEWYGYYYRTQDKRAHKWGDVLRNASNKLLEITVDLAAIKDEHDSVFNQDIPPQ